MQRFDNTSVRRRVLGVGDEVQNHHEQQPGRLAEVDQAAADVVAEDFLRVAQVGVDDHGVLVARQDGPAVRDRDRVDVDEYDAGPVSARG